MHRNLAGNDGRLFQRFCSRGIVLRDAVSLCKRHKALGVCRDLIQKLRLKIVTLFHEGFDLFFDVCVFFLADSERAHHVAQRRAERGNESRCAAAAGSRLVGGENRDKLTAGFCRHIHEMFLLNQKERRRITAASRLGLRILLYSLAEFYASA